MYSYGSPHMAAQKQDDQHEHTFSSYVRIRDVVLKTYLGRWTIGRSGERGSGISVLPARYDDDDICIYIYKEKETERERECERRFQCNGHCHRIWTKLPEFKSWVRQFTIRYALIISVKVWNPSIIPPATGK